MIIEYLEIENFRIYKGPIHIDFSEKKFTIIKGTNGAGKTTILNALSWCLYGKEMHKISENSSAIYNDILEDRLQSGDSFDVSVKIGLLKNKSPNNIEKEKYTIKRTLKYTKTKNDIYEDNSGSILSILFNDGRNDRPLDYPELFIEKNLPKKIEKYFFFDGEKLESYFNENSEDTIEKAVFNIVQLNLFCKNE